MRLNDRLQRLEQESSGNGRIVTCFVRYHHKEEDFTKQEKEFRELHPYAKNSTFVSCVDYGYLDDPLPYEDFISESRSKTGAGNLFTWW